jgi:hypothetical protein
MSATLTPEQLDDVYTQACRAMTDAGEARGELFLARLALLLMKEVGDASKIAGAIDTARRSVEAG